MTRDREGSVAVVIQLASVVCFLCHVSNLVAYSRMSRAISIPASAYSNCPLCRTAGDMNGWDISMAYWSPPSPCSYLVTVHLS